MKFLLKQLRLFFPFVFPMYWISPRAPDELIIEETVTLKKQIEKLEARVKELEDKEKARNEGIMRMLSKIPTL